MRDEVRQRIQTAGQELHPLPPDPPLVRDGVLPQYVGTPTRPRGPRCRTSPSSACAVSEMRCRVLHLIPHGRYTCTRGFEVDSRCDFTCSPGYRFEGEHTRTCLPGGSWSGAQPVCTGEPKGSVHGEHRRGRSPHVCWFD